MVQLARWLKPSSPDPNAASRCTSLGVMGGWGEEGATAYLLLDLCHLFGWLSTPVMLTFGLTEEDKSLIFF